MPRDYRYPMKREHPIWGILRLAVLLTGLFLILRGNASNFDLTEMKTLGEFGLLLAGVQEYHRRKGAS